MAEIVNRKKECPCSRKHCERHGNCAACIAYHKKENQFPTACQRGKDKREKTV